MSVDKIVTTTKSRFDERARKKRIREIHLQKLIVTHNSGLFKITPELFSFLSIFDDDIIILEDSLGNPVSCDRKKLLEDSKKRYNEVMNLWHIEFGQK